MTIKQEIVHEYLIGKLSYRELSGKYGFGSTSIHRWVSEHRLQQGSPDASLRQKGIALSCMKEDVPKEELLKQIVALQQQLEQERLKVNLLNAIIDIAEKELQVPIRKKSGTRQSKE